MKSCTVTEAKSKLGEQVRGALSLTEGLGQLRNTQDMNTLINANELRASLPKVVAKIRRGARFTVLYRSRPAFQVIPVDAATHTKGNLSDDPLYRAKPLGRSTDGRSAADHDTSHYRA